MKVLTLPFHYVAWHYTRGIVDVWHTFTNILWFLQSFFSFSLLLKTLFNPWQRLRERYDRRNGLGDILGSFFVNTLMRVVGLAIRLVTILVGMCVYIVVLLVGTLFIFLWLFIPPLLVFFCIAGVLAIVFNGQFNITHASL